MANFERTILITHERTRMKYLARKLGGVTALAQALEEREVYVETISSLNEDEHDKFIELMTDDSEVEDPLFEAEVNFDSHVKEVFQPIFGYKFYRVTNQGIMLERDNKITNDSDAEKDITRLIGKLQEDGSFTTYKEWRVTLPTGDRFIEETEQLSPHERLILNLALNQLQDIDVLIELESDL